MSAPATFLLGVLMGSASAISTKVIYELSAVGASGETKHFEKPLLVTWLMFLSMTLAIPMHWVNEWYQRKKDPNRPGLETSWRSLFLFLLPAGFDLLATALGTAGLLFTTVSVYQLVRCSVMIMTALLKVVFFRQKLAKHMWMGLGINTVAMLMISYMSVLPDHLDEQPGVRRDPKIGIFLILLSCVVQASQYVFEEKLMTDDQAAPLLVVGMEGVWGSLIMPIIVFPWAAMLPGDDYGGCMENIYDSWVMMQNSSAICWMLFVFFATVFAYNVFAIYVTYLLNSIWHAILENFRPCAVWLLDLMLFYWITNRTFGEAWTKYSWIQLVGMITMMVGTAIYNASVKLSFLDYEHDPEIPEDDSLHYATSNSITSSPLIHKGAARQQRLAGFAAINNLGQDAHRAEADEENEFLTRGFGQNGAYANGVKGRTRDSYQNGSTF